MIPLEALLRYPLFSLLGERALQIWAQQGEPMEVQLGQTLLQAGQPGEHIFVLLRGRVRVHRTVEEREVPVGSYGPGDVFGEYALLPPHLNTATCRGREPGRVVRLRLAPVQGLLATLPGVADNLKNWLRLHALVTQLRGGPSLGFLSATSVLPLLDRCNETKFPDGHAIQADGLCGDRWFFINSGEVSLRIEGGEPMVLRPGSCFGERALLGRGRLTLAEARGPVTCSSLTAEDFARPVGGGEAPSRMQTAGAFPARGIRHEWLAQRTPVECGVAALAMALRGHSVDVTRERVAALVPLGEHGANFQTLCDAAQQLGCRAALVRIALERVGDVVMPAVAHLSGGHYVTLFERVVGGVIVGDPESGIRTWSIAELAGAWSGNILLLGVRPNRAATSSR